MSEPSDPVRGPLPGHESAPAAPGRFITTRVEVEGREEVKTVERPVFEPEPWDADARLTIVGQPVPRADALAKVTGQARYTTDIVRPGMLHAAILRSPVARGRLTSLDVEAARRVPGVRDVIIREDLPKIGAAGGPLLDPEVRYAGQPVAAVCADTVAQARAGVAALGAIFTANQPVATGAAALEPGAPAVRGTGNRTRSSPRVSKRGDADRGLAEADVTITREYRTPAALHSAMEPHGAVAEWDGDALTVWESTQGIFNTRADLADAFGLQLARVRVVSNYMGGGFGAKNGASTNAYLATALARRTGRAVSCINDREGEQIDSGNRPSTVQRVTLGARRDGTLSAIVLDAEITLGIDGWQGGPAKFYHEMYSCPNVRTTETFAYVNAGAMASFRAPGHVEGAFGLERAMDVLARELGLDPLDLRLRNYASTHEEKGRPFSAKRLDECYRAGAEAFGWRTRTGGGGSGAKRADTEFGGAPRAERSGSRLRRGFGMASQVWGGGGGPPAYAIVRIHPDATADVLTGTQDLGTGTRTVFAQIAAESLGARLADVRVILGDTDKGPYTGNSWGSMTVASVGPAVRLAAMDARAQLLDAAAGMLDVPAVRLSTLGSIISVEGEDRALTFADVTAKLGDVMIIGTGNRGPNPDGLSLSTFGAQFAEVEVDVDSGVVRVVRLVAAHDAGRVINPRLARSQLEGGIIQGVGYAVFEERVLDERSAFPLNPTLHDYKLPTIGDIPAIHAFCVDGADTAANHTGAKGLAEPPIIPTAPAIANAVADALGVEIDALPLAPWRIIAAMRAGTA